MRETAAAYKCQIYPGFLAATMEHTCSMSTINPLTFCPSLRELTCPNDVSSVYYLKTSYVHALERRRRRFSGGDCDFHFFVPLSNSGFPVSFSPEQKEPRAKRRWGGCTCDERGSLIFGKVWFCQLMPPPNDNERQPSRLRRIRTERS